MSPETWVPYDFAVLHVVPHPFLGTCQPIGVIVHAPTAEYLGVRLASAQIFETRHGRSFDVGLLDRYLDSLQRICEGDPAAGPLALASRSERFHWATAPRSDVLQSGPVHSGICRDPAHALAQLYATYLDR
jgi:hypothetical protein